MVTYALVGLSRFYVPAAFASRIALARIGFVLGKQQPDLGSECDVLQHVPRGTFVVFPTVTDDVYVRSMYFFDPDGICLEFACWNLPPEGFKPKDVAHEPRRADGSKAIAAFVEKPDAATAQRYLDSGDYLWNSGLFMVRASTWLKAIDSLQPAMAAACVDAWKAGARDADFVRVAKDAFGACPSDSIDYAVMEKLAAAEGLGIAGCVVPMSAGWSDVGAWDALWQIADKDGNGNVARGDVLFEDSRDTLVYAQDRLVACVGLEGAVIVETPDAVLVASKDKTQNVKQIVAALKASKRSQASAHRKIHRPWGWYDSIDNGSRFQVKRIVVNPGASLSLQMHHHRAEHWIVVKGTAEVTNGERTFLLGENESTYIPLGHVHRLANPGKLPLEIIEVQSGSYLGEDDIVRFEDTYGRG